MEFDAVLLPARRAAMIAAGHWPDRTLNDDLDACVAQRPDQLALTAYRLEAGDVRRFSYRELARMADRIAIGLTRLGVGRNDVVACQLPNWWHFTLTYLACTRIGAVLNPLMHIFRERELRFMLGHGEAKVLIVPRNFRGFDFEAMANALQPELPSLKQVVVVDGEGANSFEALLSGPQWEDAPDAAGILQGSRPGPDDINQLIYTSGTTGEPKGVMHSSNTLLSALGPFMQRLHLSASDVVLMASPMAHQTGFMYGLMMPVALGARAVLQDIWDPKRAVEIIRAEAVSFTMASTPFLSDLTRTVAEAGARVDSLRLFACGGAPIPGPLVEQARAVLGSKIISLWGMSENGAVTMLRPEDDDALACTTDGCALPGMAVKVVDDAGAEMPAGEVGRLLTRSCSNFGGYLRRPQWNNTDADDWFDTGDLARMDANGYIRITGRSKDVIIRGGENIPVVEIESLLFRHPAIAMVAIVAFPDERLGERACATVVCKPGQAIDLPGMVQYLKAQKVAAQYIPERLEVLDAMPTTPAGKIQKFKLREQLRAHLGLI
jgi:cyclohexanecarboxylate-CoA ligase